MNIKITMNIQKKLNDYFGIEQDFTEPYWDDMNRVKMYLECIKNDLHPCDADRYVHIYDLFGKDVGIKKFFDIDSKMYNRSLDILDAEEKNKEYKELKKLLFN